MKLKIQASADGNSSTVNRFAPCVVEKATRRRYARKLAYEDNKSRKDDSDGIRGEDMGTFMCDMPYKLRDESID